MKANKNAPLPTPPASRASYTKQALLGMYGVIGVSIATIGVFKVPFAEGYAKEYWRQALAGLVLLIALIASIISLAIYMFDANYFKSQIVEYVKTNKQRDLILEGDLKVTFFPKLGIDSNKITLSQRNSNKVFASIDNARLNIAWWPLLFKQLQIESVTLDRLHANIIRDKNGRTNFDDLLVPDGSLSDVKFEIDNILVQNSSANYQDEAADLFLTLHDMNIETDRIADLIPSKISASFRLGSSKPRIETRVKFSTHLVFDRKGNHFEFANFEGAAEGEAAGMNKLVLNFQGGLKIAPATEKWVLDTFSTTAKGEWGGRNLDAKLDIAKFQSEKIKAEQNGLSEDSATENLAAWNVATGKALTLHASLLQGDENLQMAFDLPAWGIKNRRMQADVFSGTLDFFKQGQSAQGKFSSPLSYDLATRQLQLPALVSTFNLSHTLLANKLNAISTGNFMANFSEQSVKLSFNTKVEDSNFAGSAEVENFASPAYTFEVSANAIDMDKYLVADWSKRLLDDAQPLNFSGLKTLNLRGKLRSDEFKFAKIKASKLHAEISVNQANLVIEPIAARLYGGTLLGSANISATDIPKILLQQKLSGVQIDALLSDVVVGAPKLTGRGHFTLDVSATGSSLGEMRKNINGDASLAVARGLIAGINLTEALVASRNLVGINENETKGIHTVGAKFTEVTAFSELKTTFAVLQSMARSSDILLKSATFTSKGEGEIFLDSSVLNAAQPNFGQMNFKLNTTIDSNLRRSKNGALAELAGIRVPMQISGDYTKPSIMFDFGAATGGNIVKLAHKNKVLLDKAQPDAVQPNEAKAHEIKSGEIKSGKVKSSKVKKPTTTVEASKPSKR